jgi:hypothetical protein
MLRKSLSLALVAILACAFFMVLPGAQSARADDWTRVADRGFDSNYAMQQDLVSSSFTDGVFYYVGTQSATGFSLWRYDGANWKRLAKEGLGNRDDNSIDSMCMYNGKLYIGCGRGSNNNGCAMYTFDGSHFSKVTDDAFGATGNGSFLRMAVFQGKLYAGTFNPFDGCQVWCYDGVHWTQVNDSGFGTAWNSGVYAMAQTQDHLYIGLRNDQDGCTLRTYDGTTWANITDPQLNVSANVLIQSMFSFNDGTNDQVLFGVFNEGTGCQIWLRNDTGDTLTQVVANGFGDAHNTDAPAI